MADSRPDDSRLVFPGKENQPWTLPAYQSWSPRSVQQRNSGGWLWACAPGDLRHSFAWLLLHEGRNVIYVARQLGHDARLTLTRGHVVDELEDQPRIEADAAIANARLSVRMGGAAAAEFGS